MYSDIPFWLSLVLMLGGLAVLAWSSDVFVDGSAAVAKALGISPFNIAMILGVAVLIFPLVVRPSVSFVAGSGLAAISLFSLWVLSDGICSRTEACLLLGAFLVILPLYCWYDQKTKG